MRAQLVAACLASLLAHGGGQAAWGSSATARKHDETLSSLSDEQPAFATASIDSSVIDQHGFNGRFRQSARRLSEEEQGQTSEASERAQPDAAMASIDSSVRKQDETLSDSSEAQPLASIDSSVISEEEQGRASEARRRGVRQRGEAPRLEDVVALYARQSTSGKKGVKLREAAVDCEKTMKRLYDARLWEQLGASLSSVGRKGPAVMLLATAAHRSLLHNFLCSLGQVDARLLEHVIVWCADKVTEATLVSDWERGGVSERALKLDSVWNDQDKPTEDALYRSAHYSKIADVKAFMPWAAAVLGYDALVQDVDIVWRVDMLAYIAAVAPNARGVVMADTRKVSEEWCRCDARKDSAKLKKLFNPRFGAAEPDCGYYCCNTNVNGGFVYTAAAAAGERSLRGDESSGVLIRGDFARAVELWAAKCPEISLRRRNQPYLAEALLSTMSNGDCVYAEERPTTTRDPRTWRANKHPANAAQNMNMAVLDFNLIASGENFSHVEETDKAARLLMYHGNFVSGVENKCEHLRSLGMLFTDFGTCVSPTDVADGVCDPLSGDPRKCTLGKCLKPTPRARSTTNE